MTDSSRISLLSRRDALKAGAMTGAALALTRWGLSEAQAQSSGIIMKTIPSTGEKIPCIGVGTNNYSPTTPEELEARKQVLKRLPELGCSVVDTAPLYRDSERVIGNLVKELGIRDKLFIATKCMARNNDVAAGKAEIENSFKLLQTDVIDLMQVHNLVGTDAIMPVLLELKQAKRFRYVGITTSSDEQHAEMLASMKKHPLDFIQVNYSIGDREAEKEILPTALDKGIAVLINVPFGGRRGSLFPSVQGRPLPDWASEFGAKTWAQFFLKYSLSHPAVTCAIPGMTKVSHVEDNVAGGSGVLPDAKMRKRMEDFWASLS
ncbi:MAG TPA: aldo/keto reductase [Steroidobacteraceae bacterium]